MLPLPPSLTVAGESHLLSVERMSWIHGLFREQGTGNPVAER